MPLPALKLEEFGNELSVPWLRPNEFRLRQIVAELERSKAASPLEAAARFHVLGSAHVALGAFKEGLRHFELAANIRRDRNTLLSMGIALQLLGRNVEALRAWAEASELESDRDPVVLANLAEAFAILGREDDAWDALHDAIAYTDPSNVKHLFIVANQAAELGADDVALEMFVRFVAISAGKPIGIRHVAEFIQTERPVNMDLTRCGALEAVIRRAVAFGDSVAKLRRHRLSRVENVDDNAIASALEVFESTRPMRERATEAALESASTFDL